MMDELVVVHRRADLGPGQLLTAAPGEWIQWQTCLRLIAMGLDAEPAPLLTAGDDVFQGEEAYQFLLEVICGLHSPVLGETEVLGQFKDLVEKSRTRPEFLRLFLNLITDAKKIREQCLRDLGSQSYGSLLRRHVKGVKEIHIVGAGQLAKEILPWLYDKVPVIHVHCRDIERGRAALGAFGKLRWHRLGDTSAVSGVLLLAAPVSADRLSAFFRISDFEKIVDLRRESRSDLIQTGIPVLRLQEFFDQIHLNRSEIVSKVDAAKKMISELALARVRGAEIRPFGWEDLCG